MQLLQRSSMLATCRPHAARNGRTSKSAEHACGTAKRAVAGTKFRIIRTLGDGIVRAADSLVPNPPPWLQDSELAIFSRRRQDISHRTPEDRSDSKREPNPDGALPIADMPGDGFKERSIRDPARPGRP